MPLAILVALPQAAEAKKLPKNAKPMTAEEVIAIYSGNSAVWDGSKAYFSPEKRVKGVFGKGTKRVTYAGEWSVTDNEACMKNSAKGDPKIYTDCWKWWHVGTKTITLWSVHYDETKPDDRNGYYDEMRSIKKGDKVSKEYEELGGL
ncbi:DUF995 domain-containing protein [Taklimakanibacter deserti]|uniref:DUF995 domain-containing protein n=1 Tax=Taklimakanibacter deserti TaxID=2267839 RepID=UPI0013C3EACC